MRRLEQGRDAGLLLVATGGWIAFWAVLRYWPAMLGWLGLVSIPAYVVSIVLYCRSACELCGHTCVRHFMSLQLYRCTICGCVPGARDMLRWPLSGASGCHDLAGAEASWASEAVGRGTGYAHADEQKVNSASVGITLVISTVIGLASGYYADRWLGTAPWLTMIGLGIGIVVGFVNLFRATRR